MKPIQLVISLIILHTYSCEDINEFFNKINKDTIIYNSLAAQIAWNYSIDPDNPFLRLKSANYQRKRITWQQNACDKFAGWSDSHLLNETQQRQAYLLCRGPKFTFEEARITSALYEQLQSIYSNAEICLPTTDINDIKTIESTLTNYINTIKLLNSEHKILAGISTDEKECFKGEDIFEKLMKHSSNEEVLKWVWLVWREKVGPPMKKPYRDLVVVENQAARRNGYTNIGESWRDDLEIPQLRKLCRQLYNEIKPLYTLLHGVTRFFLRRRYGDVVAEKGPIPAHLLGDLWSQDWESLADLIVPDTIDLDASMKRLNWTVTHMVKRAEDFYQSLGLPPMTETFWRESVLKQDGAMRCHGSAADMYKDDDFRLLYCSGTSFSDLYVIHHELGHIQYFMAYENQPGIFRQANTALHETIGDAIMIGVMTPQHLHRLGLVNDSVLYTNNDEKDIDDFIIQESRTKSLQANNRGKQKPSVEGGKHNYEYYFQPKTNDYRNTKEIVITKKHIHLKTSDIRNLNNDDKTKYDQTEYSTQDVKLKVTTDEILMLKLALNKIPQIPFALLIDEYRWKYFEGVLDERELNKEFWRMAFELQGIVPPSERGEEFFDIGAKFHVPDNTPYIRYFLSSFLQYQLYESLCKAAVFGRSHAKEDIPASITLNRCDIYGSKAVGKLLKDFMSRGDSQTWQDILQSTINTDRLSSQAINKYYQSLKTLLTRFVHAYQIPLGW